MCKSTWFQISCSWNFGPHYGSSLLTLARIANSEILKIMRFLIGWIELNQLSLDLFQ
ncbi:28882_t:CDS:1, partial [Racocetra persica]